MLEIQALKGNIQVCCRIRPFNQTEVDRGDEPAVELITETEVIFSNKIACLFFSRSCCLCGAQV